MFFAYALLSMLGYALHEVFLVRYTRTKDSLSLALYRHIALIFVMIPALFLGNTADIFLLGDVWKELALACVFGALAEPFFFLSQRFLPIGVLSAMGQLRVIFLFLLAYVFLGETVTMSQLIFVAIILGGVAFLSLQKHHLPHLDSRTRKGLLCVLAMCVLGSLTFFFMSMAARKIDPLVVAYFWEAGIGIPALALVAIRSVGGGVKFEKMPWKEFLPFAGIVSLTLLGTGGFALAADSPNSSLGMIGAVGSAGIVVVTLLCGWIYKEHLKFRQWMGITVVIFGVVGLRLAGL